jgi:hypothetical protein
MSNAFGVEHEVFKADRRFKPETSTNGLHFPKHGEAKRIGGGTVRPLPVGAAIRAGVRATKIAKAGLIPSGMAVGAGKFARKTVNTAAKIPGAAKTGGFLQAHPKSTIAGAGVLGAAGAHHMGVNAGQKKQQFPQPPKFGA